MGKGFSRYGVPALSFGLAVILSWAAGPRAFSLRTSGDATGSCNVTISGPDHLCAGETATYKAKGTPPNGGCTWELIDSPGVTKDSEDDCTVTLKADPTATTFKLKVTYKVNQKECVDVFNGKVQELIVIPVCARLLRNSDGTKGTDKTAADVEKALAQANAIWKHCCIKWELKETETVKTPAEQDGLASSIEVRPTPNGGSESPGFAKVNQIGHDKKCVNVMFVKKLTGQGFTTPPQYPANGGAPTGLDDAGTGVDDAANENTLAHELGHQVGLGHANRGQNLMSRGASGTELTDEQCEVARKNAKLLLQALAAQ
jgi:hypothetical protein